MSDLPQNQEPLKVEIVKAKKNKRTLLLAGIVIVLGLGIGGYFIFSKPAGTPTPTNQHIQKMVLRIWSKYDAVYSTSNQTIDCTYDPTKIVIGYKFDCSIYNGQNVEIGNSQVVTEAPSQGTWNFNVSITPDNPISQ